jgi:hypothetical protein
MVRSETVSRTTEGIEMNDNVVPYFRPPMTDFGALVVATVLEAGGTFGDPTHELLHFALGHANGRRLIPDWKRRELGIPPRWDAVVTRRKLTARKWVLDDVRQSGFDVLNSGNKTSLLVCPWGLRLFFGLREAKVVPEGFQFKVMRFYARDWRRPAWLAPLGSIDPLGATICRRRGGLTELREA